MRLGVSGMLWRDGLVMFDRDTRTLWARVTGGVELSLPFTVKGRNWPAGPAVGIAFYSSL